MGPWSRSCVSRPALGAAAARCPGTGHDVVAGPGWVCWQLHPAAAGHGGDVRAAQRQPLRSASHPSEPPPVGMSPRPQGRHGADITLIGRRVPAYWLREVPAGSRGGVARPCSYDLGRTWEAADGADRAASGRAESTRQARGRTMTTGSGVVASSSGVVPRFSVGVVLTFAAGAVAPCLGERNELGGTSI